VERLMSRHKPTVVFHAAAYKHVPLMEENVDEAVSTNILGTQNVADAAVLNGVKSFVFISTDKAVNPVSVMGMTKRLGELVAMSLNGKGDTHFCAVRFGNVLGSRGSVVPIFQEQIRKGGPVTVTDAEAERYFMVPVEAALLVLAAGALGKGGEIFVLDMGRPIKIVDLARELIPLSGLQPDVDIPIIFTSLRPGERLSERIFGPSERVVATEHPKILKVEVDSSWPDGYFERHLERLQRLAE